MEIKLIRITQPIGIFFVGKLSSSVINNISYVNRINENNGIQRRLNEKKVKEISNYCDDPDATFPTSIILNIETINSGVKLQKIEDDIYSLKIDTIDKVCEIIDGQHRIIGINKTKHDIEMPVVIMFDLTEEEKAYVFSTINSNQTKVDKSTIYQLFDLSTKRSPLKTCHDIARLMNSSTESPFFHKLKMLGYKSDDSQSLSQGTFVNELVKLISKDLKQANQDMIDIKNGISLEDIKGIPLRDFFINERDDVIYKILFNYFSAIKDVFQEEWNDHKNYILTKTTGFGALILVFNDLFFKGNSNKDLTYNFFKSQFEKAKSGFSINNKKLTSDFYSSGAKEQKELHDDIMNFISN